MASRNYTGENIDKAMDRTLAETASERAVLMIYARHAGKDLLAWPGQDLISRRVGVSERHVSTLIGRLSARGELKLVRRGIEGKSTNVFRVSILDDEFEVIEQIGNRNRGSGSDTGETRTVVPVHEFAEPELQGRRNRNFGSSGSTKEEAPSRPASETDGEVRNIAEKREGLKPTVVSSNGPNIASGAVAGWLGNRAHDRPEHLKDDPKFDQWLEEIAASHG